MAGRGRGLDKFKNIQGSSAFRTLSIHEVFSVDDEDIIFKNNIHFEDDMKIIQEDGIRIGDEDTEAVSDSISIGKNAVTTGNNSISIGNNALSTEVDGVVIGTGTPTNSNAKAVVWDGHIFQDKAWRDGNIYLAGIDQTGNIFKTTTDISLSEGFAFEAYDNTGGQSFTTSSSIVLNLDAVRVNTGDFSLSSNEVTVMKSGLYNIVFRVSTDISSGSARSTSGCFLELNTGTGFSEVIGSRGYMYNRTVGNAANTGTVNITLQLAQMNKLRIGIFRFTGSDTITTLINGSGITITSVGSAGPKGEDGADGDIVWTGEWVSQNYIRNQAVSYLGSSYVCVTNTTMSQIPTDSAFWDILASKGDPGPSGSGSTINVMSQNVLVPGSPFEKLNFQSGTITQNGVDSTQADISFGFRHYGASAVDPVSPSPSAGDKYFNTTINHEMFYDASRSKWLSVALMMDGCGKNGTNTANSFYRRFNGMTLAANTGPVVPRGTIVAIGFGTASPVSHVFEVLVSGVSVASLSSGGLDNAYDDTFNVDFNQGKFSGRSAAGSGTTNNFQATIFYRLRA
mgnify:CR=1 FL=1